MTQSISAYRREWFSNIRGDLLAGIVVALALIPEAVGFSIIAGVDPKVGLFASVAIACTTAITGGRPAMISAATAATAVLMGPLVRDHGIQYLFAATILMGILQIFAGMLKLGRLMRFVSKSVMTGFVNSLAILIFLAQLPQLINVPQVTYLLIALALGIIYLFPYVTKAIPSPLVAIAAVTILALSFGIEVPTVADLGAMPTALPDFLLPDVPLTFETLRIIFPYSLALAAVGLLESLLTAQIVDEMTDTTSSKTKECFGQGSGNIVAALFGGMGGCAMIGQSVINVTSGGRGRLSTFASGIYLLILLLVLDDILRIVPVAALVAVMIMVAIGTFSWKSVIDLKRHPGTSSIVMLSTVAVVLATHDLSKGVIVGVLLSGVFFAGKVARMVRVSSSLSEDGKARTYAVEGQVFFASADALVDAFDFAESLERVTIDVRRAHLWDISAVGALDRAVMKFRSRGIAVEVIGANEASASMIDRFALHDKEHAALSAPPGH
ncbi:SulP family inorganic anion transporter [Neorhizobium sp. AL 9.2.2]|uniref:SulP family inorganic anion transporter n=1 Tax=Neorhizobium sp. AL 9.2.2 TaxID=2712894 RepID=UPI001571A742|nr:SulP family inorganic anion transporter [Neorhizobium sp. AL 9.2.2]NSY16846.1 SulP family inorganic anion transporter [Neorhizobium sp. AL 9.2.2]